MSERHDHLQQRAVLKITQPDMPSEAPGSKESLARLAASGASAAQTADIAVSTWTAIDAALSPIVGQRGFAALYKRSLHLARAEFAWLTEAQEGVLQVADFSSLCAALAAQPDATAIAASTALLKIFHDLLTSLIGRSLTDRLLRSVWDKPTSGQPAQDTSP